MDCRINTSMDYILVHKFRSTCPRTTSHLSLCRSVHLFWLTWSQHESNTKQATSLKVKAKKNQFTTKHFKTINMMNETYWNHSKTHAKNETLVKAFFSSFFFHFQATPMTLVGNPWEATTEDGPRQRGHQTAAFREGMGGENQTGCGQIDLISSQWTLSIHLPWWRHHVMVSGKLW